MSFKSKDLRQGDILSNIKGRQWTVTSSYSYRTGGVDVQNINTGERRTIFSEYLAIPWVRVDRPGVGMIYSEVQS